MKTNKIIPTLIICLFISFMTYAQSTTTTIVSLNQHGALELAKEINKEANKINKNVSIAILDASGNILLLLKGDNVGPHNTLASQRKAYTSLSTKTSSLELMEKAENSTDSKNLNTIPELLLLGGGVPVWKDGQLIGSVGVSGGGGGANDNSIAVNAIRAQHYSEKP